jgi:hypothetical protein
MRPPCCLWAGSGATCTLRSVGILIVKLMLIGCSSSSSVAPGAAAPAQSAASPEPEAPPQRRAQGVRSPLLGPRTWWCTHSQAGGADYCGDSRVECDNGRQLSARLDHDRRETRVEANADWTACEERTSAYCHFVIDLRHRRRTLCFESGNTCDRSRAAANTAAGTRVSPCVKLPAKPRSPTQGSDGGRE